MATMKIMDSGVSASVTTNNSRAVSPYIRIKNSTKQGYLEAHEGDAIDLTSSNTINHRGVVQKGKSQTIVCADGGGEV